MNVEYAEEIHAWVEDLKNLDKLIDELVETLKEKPVKS